MECIWLTIGSCAGNAVLVVDRNWGIHFGDIVLDINVFLILRIADFYFAKVAFEIWYHLDFIFRFIKLILQVSKKNFLSVKYHGWLSQQNIIDTITCCHGIITKSSMLSFDDSIRTLEIHHLFAGNNICLNTFTICIIP